MLEGRIRVVGIFLFALIMSLNGFVFGIISIQLVPLLEAAGLVGATAVWVASLRGHAGTRAHAHVQATQQATKTIPIVFSNHSDQFRPATSKLGEPRREPQWLSSDRRPRYFATSFRTMVPTCSPRSAGSSRCGLSPLII